MHAHLHRLLRRHRSADGCQQLWHVWKAGQSGSALAVWLYTTADLSRSRTQCTGGPSGSTATCQSGTCKFACHYSTTQCGNSCVDLKDDIRNCGGCGNHVSICFVVVPFRLVFTEDATHLIGRNDNVQCNPGQDCDGGQCITPPCDGGFRCGGTGPIGRRSGKVIDLIAQADN